MKVKIDENLPAEIADELRALGHRISLAGWNAEKRAECSLAQDWVTHPICVY